MWFEWYHICFLSIFLFLSDSLSFTFLDIALRHHLQYVFKVFHFENPRSLQLDLKIDKSSLLNRFSWKNVSFNIFVSFISKSSISVYLVTTFFFKVSFNYFAFLNIRRILGTSLYRISFINLFCTVFMLNNHKKIFKKSCIVNLFIVVGFWQNLIILYQEN